MEEDEKRVLGLSRSTAVIAGIVTILMASTGLTFGLLTSSVNIPNTGVVSSVNIGVYTTQQCTANLTQISWGAVSPGSSYTYTGYVRNNGNVGVTLSMSTTNWSPAAAATAIGITWNYGGSTISPGQVLAVVWTMSIPSSVSGIQNFSFTIVVSGSG